MSVKFDDYLKEQLKDPEFRKEYERLEIELKLDKYNNTQKLSVVEA